jgi:hypothetical protein
MKFKELHGAQRRADQNGFGAFCSKQQSKRRVPNAGIFRAGKMPKRISSIRDLQPEKRLGAGICKRLAVSPHRKTASVPNPQLGGIKGGCNRLFGPLHGLNLLPRQRPRAVELTAVNPDFVD